MVVNERSIAMQRQRERRAKMKAEADRRMAQRIMQQRDKLAQDLRNMSDASSR